MEWTLVNEKNGVVEDKGKSPMGGEEGLREEEHLVIVVHEWNIMHEISLAKKRRNQ